MRYGLVGLWMLLSSAVAAATQVSVGVWLPGISIGINQPAYPQFVVVPGYPVYYAPRLGWNYFFYDGMYWVFVEDAWYASYWYNGPWMFVSPEYVPVYVLRVPVRYYMRPPAYFRWWRPDRPPRWGEHWGPDWERHRPGWDRWQRHAAPAPAPLPEYQRQFAGERYPRLEEQQELHQRHYRYRPRDAEVRQFQAEPQRPRVIETPPPGRRDEPDVDVVRPRPEQQQPRQRFEVISPPPVGAPPRGQGREERRQEAPAPRPGDWSRPDKPQRQDERGGAPGSIWQQRTVTPPAPEAVPRGQPPQRGPQGPGYVIKPEPERGAKPGKGGKKGEKGQGREKQDEEEERTRGQGHDR